MLSLFLANLLCDDDVNVALDVNVVSMSKVYFSDFRSFLIVIYGLPLDLPDPASSNGTAKD